MKIAKDTPKELIEIASAVDINKIPKEQLTAKITQLDCLVRKFLSIRLNKPVLIDVPVAIPQGIADMTIKYDLNVGQIRLALGLPLIRKYVRENLPLKRAI